MTVDEIVKVLSKYPPNYEVKIWCSENETDWNIERIEESPDYPRKVFIVEGDD